MNGRALLRRSYAEAAAARDAGREPDPAFVLQLQLQVLAHYQSTTTALLDLQERCREDGVDRLAIVERSPLEVKEVFMPCNGIRGEPSKDLILAIWSICDHYLELPVWRDAKYVFLMLDPRACLDRVSERGRGSECRISLEYLESLDERYMELLRVRKELEVVDGSQEHTYVSGLVARLAGMQEAYEKLHPDWRRRPSVAAPSEHMTALLKARKTPLKNGFY